MTTFTFTVALLWIAYHVLRFLWNHAGRFYYGPTDDLQHPD